jgi:CRISPR-associated endoribonuclease Cas6
MTWESHFGEGAQTALVHQQVLQCLRVTPLQVILRMETPWHGPALKTLLLRSALGFHLRRRECLTGAPRCEGCTKKRDCWYSLAFDTPGDIISSTRGRDQNASHPFYFCAAPILGHLASGTRLPCIFTSFGSSQPIAEKIILALQEAGATGRWGGRFRVDEVVSAVQPRIRRQSAQFAARTVWPPWTLGDSPSVSAVHLRFLSPLRLRIQGVVQRRPLFSEIVRALLRRLHILANLYSEVNLDRAWAEPLLAQAQDMRTLNDDWFYMSESQFSARQGANKLLDGVWGEMRVAGDLSGLWPFLDVGQWIGVGASTGHGFGCYVAERA